jgi:nucleoside diphosphate kinase
LFEDVDTTVALASIVDAEERRRREPTPNTAFFFIKPHAVSTMVSAVVEAAFRENNISIVNHGHIYSEEIKQRKIIDRHYNTIYRYAMEASPSQLVVAPEAAVQFRSKFGITWQEAVESGIVFNASEAMEGLGGISPQKLGLMWAERINRVKLAPGIYVAEFFDEGVYVVNGFYPAIREKFVSSGAKVHWYVLQWAEAQLSWKDFRSKIIGATDPAAAHEASLRHTLWRQWQALDLSFQPNVSDNGVHASASPLEGLAERMVWLGTPLDEDVFGKVLQSNGCNTEMVLNWALNNPMVALPEQGAERSAPIFDLLEDRQSTEVLSILQEASKRWQSSSTAQASGTGGTGSAPGLDNGEVEEAERLKGINVAFVLVKPHACTKEVQALVESVFQVNGLHVEREADAYTDDVAKGGLVDAHFGEVSKLALEWKPHMIKLSPEAHKLFFGVFGVDWATCVGEDKVLNATDAALALGHLSPSQLLKRWNAAAKNVRLDTGFMVAYFANDDVYVINGSYPYTRERLLLPDTKMHWYVVSWDERMLTWQDFRNRLIGTENPSDAEEGSLRNAILKDWRSLGLDDVPTAIDNCVHASAGPFEALVERSVWMRRVVVKSKLVYEWRLQDDLFGKALLLAGGSEELIRDWMQNPVVDIEERRGRVFELLENLQSSVTANIVSDATSNLIVKPLRFIDVTPKRKLWEASIQDLFLNAVTPDELHELWKHYDPLNTGLIDRNAFRQDFERMETFGQSIDPSTIGRLFSNFDRLKNGKMTFEEFTMLMMARQSI